MEIRIRGWAAVVVIVGLLGWLGYRQVRYYGTTRMLTGPARASVDVWVRGEEGRHAVSEIADLDPDDTDKADLRERFEAFADRLTVRVVDTEARGYSDKRLVVPHIVPGGNA